MLSKEITLRDLGFKKQKWLSDAENEIIFENEKKSKFIIFYKNSHNVEVSTEHGFSNYINIVELGAIYNEMKGMNW